MPPPLPTTLRRNLATLLRSPAAELSGALGDLGTFLPLTLALALAGAIDLPATLVTSGLFNLVTGAVFGVPLPVQPMKVIASTTLSQPGAGEIAIPAGMLVSVAVLVLSATGLVRRLVGIVPAAVVRGIQLGAGMGLVVSAGPVVKAVPAGVNLVLAALTTGLLLATLRRPGFPVAGVVFAVGVGFVLLVHGEWGEGGGGWRPRVRNPFGEGCRLVGDGRVLAAAVGQLPLTVLNSVVAVAALGRELEGLEGVEAPEETALGVSVGLMGLVGGWVGGMPVCHGAGGLAAQYRFGARSGASIMVLGAVKMAIGLIFGGEGLIKFLGHFPGGALGVMLAAAGIELAKAGVGIYGHGPHSRARDGLLGRKNDEELTVVLVTAAAMLVVKNAGVGFIFGMMCHWSYRWADRLERRRMVGERCPLLA